MSWPRAEQEAKHGRNTTDLMGVARRTCSPATGPAVPGEGAFERAQQRGRPAQSRAPLRGFLVAPVSHVSDVRRTSGRDYAARGRLGPPRAGMEAPDEGQGSGSGSRYHCGLAPGVPPSLIRPRLFVESIMSARDRENHRSWDDRAPLLGTIGDHYRSQLKFDSGPPTAFPSTVQTARSHGARAAVIGASPPQRCPRDASEDPVSFPRVHPRPMRRRRHLRQVKCRLLDGVFQMGDS